MKAIIPVAGIGSRLRPHTHTQPKALVPVAGKPILSHIVDSLIEAGIHDLVFVIGYLGDKIQAYVTDKYKGYNTRFVVQEYKEGLGHAIWAANELISADDELLIVLGDTIFDVDLDRIIQMPVSAIGVKKVDDPRDFGVVELDDEGYIMKVTEKPTIPKSNLAMVGIYKIREGEALMNALNYNISNNIRTYNEFQLTDGLMRMIEQGIRLKTFTVDDWYDCGKKDILLETNAMLLSRSKKTLPDQKYENTIIIPPVSIAENCRISNSIIGPYVSIGENTAVTNSILRDSIIGSFSQLENVLLNNSLVGSDSTLKGLSQSLNLGDSTEISFA